MRNKKLIQILLPLYDGEGKIFPEGFYTAIKQELTEKFGGLTAYTRSPATGLWKKSDRKITRDEILIYEVVTDSPDHEYWKIYKKKLEKQFRQNELMIRYTNITLIS